LDVSDSMPYSHCRINCAPPGSALGLPPDTITQAHAHVPHARPAYAQRGRVATLIAVSLGNPAARPQVRARRATRLLTRGAGQGRAR